MEEKLQKSTSQGTRDSESGFFIQTPFVEFQNGDDSSDYDQSLLNQSLETSVEELPIEKKFKQLIKTPLDHVSIKKILEIKRAIEDLEKYKYITQETLELLESYKAKLNDLKGKNITSKKKS